MYKIYKNCVKLAEAVHWILSHLQEINAAVGGVSLPLCSEDRNFSFSSKRGGKVCKESGGFPARSTSSLNVSSSRNFSASRPLSSTAPRSAPSCVGALQVADTFSSRGLNCFVCNTGGGLFGSFHLQLLFSALHCARTSTWTWREGGGLKNVFILFLFKICSMCFLFLSVCSVCFWLD